MTKFTIALREISTYKELLRLQVMMLLSFLFFSSVLHCKGRFLYFHWKQCSENPYLEILF